jgi:hypothetical protein
MRGEERDVLFAAFQTAQQEVSSAFAAELSVGWILSSAQGAPHFFLRADYPVGSSSSALASLRSAVSKPSVNQP